MYSLSNLARHTFLTRVVLIVFSFTSNVIIARLLGPDGKGYVSLGMSWPFLLANLSTLGLETACIYFTSRDLSAFPRFIKFILLYTLIIGGTAALVFGVISIKINLFKVSQNLEILSALLLLLYVATILLNAVYTGAGLLPVFNLVSIITWFFFVLYLVTLFEVPVKTANSVLAGFVVLQALNILSLLGYSYLKGTFASQGASPSDLSIREIFVGYSLKTYPASIAGLAHLRVNILVLSFSSPAQEVGIYSVAQSIVETLFLLPVAVSTGLLPRVASAHGKEAIELVTTTTRLTFFITMALSLVVSIASVLLIPIIFGQQFQASTYVVLALIPTACAYSIVRILATYFNGINRPVVPSVASTAGVTILVVLTILLSPSQGASGAALAMSLSYIALGLWLLAVYTRSTKTAILTILLPRLIDIHLVINAAVPSFSRWIRSWIRR